MHLIVSFSLLGADQGQNGPHIGPVYDDLFVAKKNRAGPLLKGPRPEIFLDEG
jgi:hypothetical protein